MTQVALPTSAWTITSADVDVPNAVQKVLLVAQSVGGAAVADALNENVSDVAWPALAGIRSHAGQAFRAFKAIAPEVQIDFISLADGTTAAVKTVTFTSNATGVGTWHLVVGSEQNHTYEYTAVVGDTPTIVAAALEALIDLDLSCPFTASVAAGVITLTANDKGLVSEDITVGVTGDVPGQTVAVAQSIAGATDPTLTAKLNVVGERRYQAIIWPWADLTVVKAWLDPLFNLTNLIQDGIAICAFQDVHATLLTDLDPTHNSQSLAVYCDLQESNSDWLGGATPELNIVIQATVAAIRAKRLTTDSVISQYVTSSRALDQRGGTALASMPLFNTNLPSIGLTPGGLGFTSAEVGTLKDAGGFVIGRNPAGTAMLIGEVVTTYKTKPSGAADPTFEFVNYVDTISNVREYMQTNVKSHFAQSRLTEGNVIPGRDMVNELTFRGFVEKLYDDLAGSDFVLVQAGELARDFFKTNMTVVLDLAAGKITTTMKVPIITQFRSVVATIQVVFSTEE